MAKTTHTPTPAPPPDAPRELPPPAPRRTPPITVVATGTSVDGRLHAEGDLRVDGRVDGPLLVAGATCEIGRDGAAAAEQVRAAAVVVYGMLRAGEVVARRVTVAAGGVLYARVVAAESVDVEHGGTLDATLEVGVSAESPAR